MAGSNKVNANQLFGKISAYSTIVQQNLGKYLNKLSPYAKEYESTLDLVLDILRSLGYSEERLVRELLQLITGDASIGAMFETGYHGSLNSLEEKLSLIETKQENDSFINRLENGVKVIISTILTSFLTCSVSPFIPRRCIDIYYKGGGDESDFPELHPINIPTNILDFSNTLHVSPVSENGIYFYNTGCDVTYYKLNETPEKKAMNLAADTKDLSATNKLIYKYDCQGSAKTENVKYKKVISVPSFIEKTTDEPKPDEYIYTIRPQYTAEGLYKTMDMNAFIWYVANRGDNTEGISNLPQADVMYEYNKMMWDSRRMNAAGEKEKIRENKKNDDGTTDWNSWLLSKTDYSGKLVLKKKLNPSDEEETEVDNLYPILQLEPSVDYGDLEHIVATFPAQRYLTTKTNLITGDKYLAAKTIYKFNADYLRSIKIFNWKTIIMNLLYELNGICPVPDIQFHLSLSDEIIDARLSTLILDTISADDKEVDDSYYSFSNEDYSEALKRMEIKKYSAKPYDTAGGAAIQNPSGTTLDVMNSVSTAATLNEISTTITRGVYSVAGTSGSTGITKTTLSADLAFESNFVYQLLFAIVRPFVRALLSPQIMLLFCINLDTMGLINLSELGKGDVDMVQDFIFRKISGIIKKFIIYIKDEIVLYILDLVKREITALVDEIIILILLEQLNDYIRLLNQIMECIRRFGIGITVSGLDEVNYADIIPEEKIPDNT